MGIWQMLFVYIQGVILNEVKDLPAAAAFSSFIILNAIYYIVITMEKEGEQTPKSRPGQPHQPAVFKSGAPEL